MVNPAPATPGTEPPRPFARRRLRAAVVMDTGKAGVSPTDAPPPEILAAAEAESGRQMWCAVLSRMFDDACGRLGGCGLTPAARVQLTDQARHWLLEGGADLRMVCHLAGLDPDAVQTRARILIGAA